MTPTVFATDADFAEFLTKFGYSVDAETHLLPLAAAFISTLPFCDDAVIDDAKIIEAQCFVAYSISANGGGFDPAALVAAKTLTKSGLGRGAIVDEWKVNESLMGTDPMSLLKSMPLVYGMLRSYMCPGGASEEVRKGIGIAVV